MFLFFFGPPPQPVDICKFEALSRFSVSYDINFIENCLFSVILPYACWIFWVTILLNCSEYNLYKMKYINMEWMA
jgi:hypothetical protein